MKSVLKNILWGVFCLGVVTVQTGCQKDTIAPANQSVAFVKYYGHVAGQEGNDMIATSDGGFLLVGSTSSYTTDAESDAFIVKTDSGGNELWTVALGRSPAEGTAGTAFQSFFMRYDEKAKTVAELPDGNYIVGVDRTYVRYASETDPIGRPLETKVVLYLLNAADGSSATTDGNELLSASNGSNADSSYSETISDIYVDTSGGIIEYVVTGSTTNVNRKPSNGIDLNSLTDKTDIFTALIDENYNINTSWIGNLAYGFQGIDYGVSIHKVSNSRYMICGVIDQNVAPNGTDPYDFYPAVVAVLYDISSGAPTRPKYYGNEGYYFDVGGSVYDEANGRITILANVTAGPKSSNAFEGYLALLPLDELTDLQTVGTPGDFGFTYINPRNDASGGSPYVAESIDLLPNNEGFILLATKELTTVSADLGSTICLLKVDSDFNIATDAGWPYFFGYETDNATFATDDEGGSVIALTSIGAGTSRLQLDGYVFSGTFGLGTNDMIGMVKLNAAGDFTSQ